jgi:tetratricopeptide (TPR) repeat protein
MNRLFWSLIAGCHCWAQTGTPTLEQFNGRLADDLRGEGFVHDCHFEKGQLHPICTVDLYTVVPPERPEEQSIGQMVSVRQLRHKVPKEAATEFQRAIKLSRAGKHEKAAAELEAAVRRDPELSSAEDRLGVEYVYLGRWEEAEMAFRRTVDLEPAWWMGYYNLALILYRRGDLSDAEKSLRRALALPSENPQIHLALGAMLMTREETRTEGITELRFAARTMPSVKRTLQGLGAP